MEISKELFEAVIDDKVKYYCVDVDEIEYDYESFDRQNPLIMAVNDFFFKCKEWASKKGCILFSKTRLSSSLASCYFDVMGFNDYEDDFKNDFRAESEQQAVFDACQWILENKRN